MLAETERGGARADELAKFLKGHDSIAWLHGIHAGDYVDASTTLRSLAQRESELLSRKGYIRQSSLHICNLFDFGFGPDFIKFDSEFWTNLPKSVSNPIIPNPSTKLD